MINKTFITNFYHHLIRININWQQTLLMSIFISSVLSYGTSLVYGSSQQWIYYTLVSVTSTNLVRFTELEWYYLISSKSFLRVIWLIILHFSDKVKTSEEVASEGRILREMLEIVERRDSLITQLEEDRQRCGRSWSPIFPSTNRSPPHTSPPHPLFILVVTVIIWTMAHFITSSFQNDAWRHKQN